MNPTKKRNRAATRKARRRAQSALLPRTNEPPGWLGGHASAPSYERARRHGERIMAREHGDR